MRTLAMEPPLAYLSTLTLDGLRTSRLFLLLITAILSFSDAIFNGLLFSILETIMAPNLHLTRSVWHDMEKYLGASYNVNKGNSCNDYNIFSKG